MYAATLRGLRDQSVCHTCQRTWGQRSDSLNMFSCAAKKTSHLSSTKSESSWFRTTDPRNMKLIPKRWVTAFPAEALTILACSAFLVGKSQPGGQAPNTETPHLRCLVGPNQTRKSDPASA